MNNLHFIAFFTHTEQSPDKQQSIKEPSYPAYLQNFPPSSPSPSPTTLLIETSFFQQNSGKSTPSSVPKTKRKRIWNARKLSILWVNVVPHLDNSHQTHCKCTPVIIINYQKKIENGTNETHGSRHMKKNVDQQVRKVSHIYSFR